MSLRPFPATTLFMRASEQKRRKRPFYANARTRRLEMPETRGPTCGVTGRSRGFRRRGQVAPDFGEPRAGFAPMDSWLLLHTERLEAPRPVKPNWLFSHREKANSKGVTGTWARGRFPLKESARRKCQSIRRQSRRLCSERPHTSDLLRRRLTHKQRERAGRRRTF